MAPGPVVLSDGSLAVSAENSCPQLPQQNFHPHLPSYPATPHHQHHADARKHIPVTRAEMHAEGRKRLCEAHGRCTAGISRGGVLGRPVARAFGSVPGYVPSEAAAAAASTYRGKIQPKVTALLRDGRILDHGTSFLQDQSEMRWAAGTAKNKLTAVNQFKAFLEIARRVRNDQSHGRSGHPDSRVTRRVNPHVARVEVRSSAWHQRRGRGLRRCRGGGPVFARVLSS